jgi:hypothetical protein
VGKADGKFTTSRSLKEVLAVNIAVLALQKNTVSGGELTRPALPEGMDISLLKMRYPCLPIRIYDNNHAAFTL